jgi:nitrogen fixation NifU-like protein
VADDNEGLSDPRDLEALTQNPVAQFKMKANDPNGGAETLPPHSHHPKFQAHLDAPCNIGTLVSPDGQATGVGSCGDSVQVLLKVKEETISEIRCRYKGCQYTLACASAVGKLAHGRTLAQALKLEPADVVAELGSLPEDHLHCARLAVNTLGEAIDDFYQKRW